MNEPTDNAVLIFAGSADIDDENMRTLLDNWIPQDIELSPPAIQASIPRASRGLRKVLKWAEEELGGDLDRPDDLSKYILGLETTSNAYLIALWGDGDDSQLEALADQASRCGLTILDLTDGLDELQLDDNTPAAEPEKPAAEREPEASPRARRSRRRQAEQAEEKAEQETPPWTEEETPAGRLVLPPDEFALVKQVSKALGIDSFRPALAALLAIAFDGAAAALQQHILDLARPEINEAEPILEAAPATDEPTRTWLSNPANPSEYKLKGRGRPRNELKNWTEVQLTATQEKQLGLG